jgi:hypothetical protein
MRKWRPANDARLVAELLLTLWRLGRLTKSACRLTHERIRYIL